FYRFFAAHSDLPVPAAQGLPFTHKFSRTNTKAAKTTNLFCKISSRTFQSAQICEICGQPKVAPVILSADFADLRRLRSGWVAGLSDLG
ncbi:MAG: hypothetical protein ACOYOU_21115, partial [Kiritimatiellia bacterium]